MINRILFISTIVLFGCCKPISDEIESSENPQLEKIYDRQGELRYLFQYDSLGNRINNYPILRINSGEKDLKIDSTYQMKLTILNLDSNNYNTIKLGITDSFNKTKFTDTIPLDMQTDYKGKFEFQVPNFENVIFVAYISEVDSSRALISDTLSIKKEHWANNIFKTYKMK